MDIRDSEALLLRMRQLFPKDCVILPEVPLNIAYFNTDFLSLFQCPNEADLIEKLNEALESLPRYEGVSVAMNEKTTIIIHVLFHFCEQLKLVEESYTHIEESYTHIEEFYPRINPQEFEIILIQKLVKKYFEQPFYISPANKILFQNPLKKIGKKHLYEYIK